MAVNNYQKDEEKTKFSFSGFRRILKFVKPYKKDVVKMFSLGILITITLLIIPKIIAYTIDVLFLNKNFKLIVIFTLIVLLLSLTATLLQKKKENISLYVVDGISHDLKMTIFEKLQYLPNSYFDTRSHGKIYTRAATYPDEVSVILCYVILEVVLDIINLILIAIFMLTTNFQLALIPLIPAFILIIFFIFLSPIRRKLKHNINNKNSNVNGYISESINGIRITQSFNREEKNIAIFKDLERKRLAAVRKNSFVLNLNWSITNIFDVVSMILIYYVALKYMYPVVSIGTILAIDTYALKFWEPIRYLTNSYNDIMDASTYLERIFELLDEPLKVENKKDAINHVVEGKIEFKNVKFSYNSEKVVLDNLNLKIKAHEKIGLVGETGSGKSTILSLISRFYDIDEGELLIDDIPIKNIDLKDLRKGISMMLQDNYLFSRSVYDNLILNKNVSLEEVRKVTKSLDIDDMIMNLENGYDTILLNNGSNLSSGERQLLCIARIMIQNPKIIVLDEATSNIDLKTERKIEKALELVTKDRTTIMVAHRITTVKNCDKIILIKDKHNFEEGTHKELMKKHGEYYKLYNSQKAE